MHLFKKDEVHCKDTDTVYIIITTTYTSCSSVQGSVIYIIIHVYLLPGMVSLWSLAVVAFERWLVVCKPLGNFAFKPQHAIACCAITWVFALMAAVPPLVGWSRSAFQDWTHPSLFTFFFLFSQAESFSHMDSK